MILVLRERLSSSQIACFELAELFWPNGVRPTAALLKLPTSG